MMTDYVTCCKSHSVRPQVGVEENSALKSGSERGGTLSIYEATCVYLLEGLILGRTDHSKTLPSNQGDT